MKGEEGQRRSGGPRRCNVASARCFPSDSWAPSRRRAPASPTTTPKSSLHFPRILLFRSSPYEPGRRSRCPEGEARRAPRPDRERPAARAIRRGALRSGTPDSRRWWFSTSSSSITSSRRPTSRAPALEDYARELVRAHGARGRAFAATRQDGSYLPVWDLDPWLYPMSAGVIRAAEAVVAHSALVTGAVLAECPGSRAHTIPQHVAPGPADAASRGARRRSASRQTGRPASRLGSCRRPNASGRSSRRSRRCRASAGPSSSSAERWRTTTPSVPPCGRTASTPT